MRVRYNVVCDEAVSLVCPACGADIAPGAEMEVDEEGSVRCAACGGPSEDA